VTRIGAETLPPERCLLVRAGDRLCALPLARVRRVVRALAVTPLPGSAPELLGLAEFGGEPLPVLDLARLVGAVPDPAAALPVTVVVLAGRDGGTELAGIAADAAADIVEVPAAAGVRPAPTREALAGDRPVTVVDLAALGRTP
jgi:chemotaxis signal transduction protein